MGRRRRYYTKIGRSPELERAVGLVILFALGIGGPVALVYGLLGYLDGDSLRWSATLAVLANPVTALIAWKVATNTAREHLRGHERGVQHAEQTLQVIGRGMAATASYARAVKTQTKPTPAAQFDDLLPRPKGGAQIVIRKPEDDEIIL